MFSFLIEAEWAPFDKRCPELVEGLRAHWLRILQ
jgi:hypothetical protein